MPDIVGGISNVISLATRLKAISDNIKNAEFSNMLADMLLELADSKAKAAGVIEQNTQLQQRIRELEQGEPCPRCHKGGWQLENSRPDPTFGVVGVASRRYKCSACGFTEEKLVK
jgi:predicted RNA-binding Zn-ribbon protein involved in translation (DUF1610 family)